VGGREREGERASVRGWLVSLLSVVLRPRAQEAVCVAMEAAAAVKPRVVLKVVQAARNRHRSAIYCDRVLAIAAAAANQ